MSQFPSISVCIPTRNGAERLPFTLRHLLERARYPRERLQVLVGDHGSTDETASIVRQVAGRDPRVELVPVDYRGPNRAFVRNRLIERATGELLVFIDHDVLAGPSFFEEHARGHEGGRALLIGYTYGKGIFRQELGDLLARLQLDDIGSSAAILGEEAALHDFRVSPTMLGPTPHLRDITDEVVPYRFAWTCNVSVRRAEIERCGAFDEAYEGWGIEDDDFARQLHAGGCRLLFSPAAWGLHVPHPTDMLPNMASWRRNYEHYFAKFPTRELELYAMFGMDVAAMHQRVERLMRLLHAVSDALPPQQTSAARSGRVATFLTTLPTAVRFGASDALDATLFARELPRVVDGVRCWSLLGLKTPFSDQELDEVAIPADRLMLVDPLVQGALIAEAVRVAGRVTLHDGPLSAERGFDFLRQQMLARLRRFGVQPAAAR